MYAKKSQCADTEQKQTMHIEPATYGGHREDVETPHIFEMSRKISYTCMLWRDASVVGSYGGNVMELAVNVRTHRATAGEWRGKKIYPLM